MQTQKIVIVMGVAGSGKSTVGGQLAARLGWTFLDADDFHPPANVAKMRAGEPLTDADRRPWLDAMRERLRAAAARDEAVVLACSALKQAYRQRLAEDVPGVRWVYLHLDRDAAHARLMSRPDHFMPATLVESQFTALEPPTAAEGALTVDACQPIEAVVEAIVKGLALRSAAQRQGGESA